MIPGLALAWALGCSPAPVAGPEAEPTPVEQVGRIVRTCREMARPIPRTPREAEKIPGASPTALEALKSGAVELYWGADLDEYGGTAVVGHEKGAPEHGGRVILADGTVADLDAEQIRDLPRPPAELLKPGASGRGKGRR
jgi:hypothetical protein